MDYPNKYLTDSYGLVSYGVKEEPDSSFQEALAVDLPNADCEWIWPRWALIYRAERLPDGNFVYYRKNFSSPYAMMSKFPDRSHVNGWERTDAVLGTSLWFLSSCLPFPQTSSRLERAIREAIHSDASRPSVATTPQAGVQKIQ